MTRGKAHECLGIVFEHGTKGEVKIDMMECLKKMPKDFPEEMKKMSSAPAQVWSFKVRENDTNILLMQEKAENFHAQAAKSSFACKRARPDIQTGMAFLTARVKQPDEDGWKKSVRVFECIEGTLNLTETLFYFVLNKKKNGKSI